MRKATYRSNGTEETRSRDASKLRLLKGTKLVPRTSLTAKLWRQGAEIELFLSYFQRNLGLGVMTKEQMKEADRVRDEFKDGVIEPFTPLSCGQSHWPYQLSETDMIKMAWAINIDQEKILVPRNENI